MGCLKRTVCSVSECVDICVGLRRIPIKCSCGTVRAAIRSELIWCELNPMQEIHGSYIRSSDQPEKASCAKNALAYLPKLNVRTAVYVAPLAKLL